MDLPHGIDATIETVGYERHYGTLPNGLIYNYKKNEILSEPKFGSDYKLSKHFTLGMLLDSPLRSQHGLSINQIVVNLTLLCQNVLEVYLEVLPGGIDGMGKHWVITSGFRRGWGSDHNTGRAVDITLRPFNLPNRHKLVHDLVNRLEPLVSYDQMILEYEYPGKAWIHTSYRGDEAFGTGHNRREKMTIIKGTTSKSVHKGIFKRL